MGSLEGTTVIPSSRLAALTVAVALAMPLSAGASFEGLDAVLAHERRAEDKARDVYRNPAETLRFFDVQPTHTVAEYAPGGGWYTRILAPYVAPKGRYIAVVFAADDTPIARVREALAGFEEGFPKRVEETTGVPAEAVRAYFGHSIPEEAHGTVDRILIPRMLHNLLRWEIADQELLALRQDAQGRRAGRCHPASCEARRALQLHRRQQGLPPRRRTSWR